MRKTVDSRNSHGFAHIGLAIAVLIVIAAIALGGWWVWQQNKDDKAANANNSGQQDQTQNQNTQSNERQKPADPSEGGRYLVIEEWGVRFPLGVSARDSSVTYSYVGTDTSNANHSEIASISLTVPENSPLSDCMNIHIDRESGEFRDSSTLAGFPVIAELGGYVFYERRSSPFCGTQDDQAEDLMDELSRTIKSLESIPPQ